MEKQEYIDMLKQGVDVWNKWTEEHDMFELDLTDAKLSGIDLQGANLSGVCLGGADLNGTNLSQATLVHTDLSEAEIGAANLQGANLQDAFLVKTDLSYSDLEGTDFSMASLKDANLNMTNLTGANLGRADLTGAQLRGACLIAADLIGTKLNWTNLSEANLSRADLRSAQIIAANLNETILYGANLTRANVGGSNLVKADFTNAILKDCFIYGVAAWDVKLQNTVQQNLVITPPNQPKITVDNLKVAQFIYLLLNNQEIRNVINTVTSKVVLILGRFTPERKEVLDALREELRKQNYLPVMFDFDKPDNRDFTETVSTLAHLARFIIADLTEPNSIPHEVATIIPQCKVPVQPLLSLEHIIIEGEEKKRREYPMFRDLRLYSWVLPTYRYKDTPSLLVALKEYIIKPAEEKAQELEKLKQEE